MYKALRHGTSEVAVKHIPCIVDDPQKLHLMRREVAIMKRVSYDPNIVQFYGACSGPDGAWVCMELMEVRPHQGQYVRLTSGSGSNLWSGPGSGSRSGLEAA